MIRGPGKELGVVEGEVRVRPPEVVDYCLRSAVEGGGQKGGVGGQKDLGVRRVRRDRRGGDALAKEVDLRRVLGTA